MAVIDVSVQLGFITAADFAANPNHVLLDGQVVYCKDGANVGKYKIGDGVTVLSALTFYGGVSTTYTASNGITLTGSNFTLNNAYFTGEISVSAGVVTLLNSAVISKVLTGYVSGAGTVSATDTILQAIQKLNGNIAAIPTGLTVGTTTITSGTNTRILYNNSGVVGEYLVTGTGTTAVLSTSPTFTTDITTPKILGGSAVGSAIQYQGTSGNGTSTVAAHQFLVGNNGATTAASIYNSGQVSIGNYASPTSQRLVTIGQDTALMSFGSLVGSTNYCAIYFNQTSPSVSNYGLIGTTNETYINTADISIGSSIGIRSSNSTLFLARGTASSGAVTPFTYTVPTNTGQTASTNIPNFKVTGSTKTWAAGTITSQYWNYFTANTAAFASASTITNSYGLYVEAATAGTYATITNNYAAGFSGNVISTGFYRSGTYIYAETDFRIAGAVVLDYSSTTLQLGTSSFFQSLALRTNGVTRLTLSTTDLTFSDSYNLIFGTTKGTKFGTDTTQKIAFWNAKPIVQPTTAVDAATFVANTSGIADDTATFDGYTIGQVVKALRNTGLLA